MKTQAYFVMLWLLHAVTWAQPLTPQSFAPPFSYRISSDYQDDLDSRFAALDKSQISTGALYSRVYPAAQLLTFNQNGQQDVSSAGHFRQVYWELYNSLYNKGNWPSPPDFDDLLKDYTFQNKVLLGVLSQDINYFKDDALSNNLLNIQNGQLYDTPNRLASPYGTVRTFVAATLMDKIKTGPVTFEFPSWLFFSNHSSALQRLEVDFGEAGVRTSYPGNSHTVAFNTSGIKTLRLTAYFLNGVVQTTFSTLNVEASNAAIADPCVKRRVIAEQGFSGYIYEEGQNVPNQGDAGYYFASLSTTDAGRGCGRTNVRKPVIILDGFDPTDNRSIEIIYGTKLIYGSRNIIEDDLIPDNYDVVVLNFPNDVEIGLKYVNFLGINIPVKLYRNTGADYIQRNAFVLVKLIKELNQQMQAEGSNEKITIIGPSMGGLISRYALAWMEKNGQTHNCKLWASFDSPHHGANIMLGDQLLLDYLGNGLGIGSAKKSVKEQLDSPAARQMLISHYRGYNSSSLTAGGALEFRDRFVGEMNDIGFPTNSCLRKIALINGSKNATFASTPCNHSLGMQAILQSFGTQVVTALFGPVANALASLKADVYTEPSTGATCKVLEREFGLGTFYKKWEINNNSFRQTSLDILPGGYYDVSGDIADQGRDKNWFYQVQFQNFFPKASFIPSVSGLALKNINRNWAENLSNINVIADTPFDAIYAPINENQNHVSLTSENVQFVKDQLNLANQQCTSGGGGCIVNKVRFVFRPDCCQDRLNGSKIQVSNDGNTWSDLYTISGNGTGSWQEFTFGNTTSYSSVRFQASGNGHGELVELEFYNNSTKLNGTAFATGGTWDNNTVVYGYQNAFDGNASGNMWHAANSGTNATAGLTLSGCGGCNLAAPTLSASPATINSGQSSSLSASNCGGTINWSTGATGSNTTVSPTQTTTYTATCTVGSCTSGNGSVTVTVNGGGGSSNCSAESIECSGNQYEVRNYSVSASNATVHTIKVQYRSHEGPGVIRWSVNGSSIQTLNVSQTGINDYVEITLGTAFLNAGTNTFSLSSGAAYLCFKKVCIQSGGRIGVAEEEEVTGKDAQTLQLYPNPTDGKVTVRYELEKGQKANLQFMNAKGQVLLQKGLVGEGGWQQTQTDLSAQPDGVYVVRMETSEKIVSRKFVIAK